MPEVVKVGMAESRVARPPDRLACFGIGSCVCVALYDPEARVAGLTHAMLPSAPASATVGPEDRAKYCDTGVPQLLDSMAALGARRDRVFARIVGGATMFNFGARPDGALSLGDRNLSVARESLKALGVEIRGEEGGGSVGRSLELDPQDGSLLVRTARQDLRWL